MHFFATSAMRLACCAAVLPSRSRRSSRSRWVSARTARFSASLREDWHSFPDYVDYRQQSLTFADMAIFNGTSRTSSGEGDPVKALRAE
jgi:hypothetical protein